MEIKDKKGKENVVADHLSRLIHGSSEEEDMLPLKESFPDEQLWVVNGSEPWYADIVNYLVTDIVPEDLSYQAKRRFKFVARQYFWDEP